MIDKKFRLLSLFVLLVSSNFSSVSLAKTQMVQPGWKLPEVEKEHGPLYTDSLLGLVIQGGNTIDNTVAFNSTNSLVLKSEIIILSGHYNYGWDESGLSSRNWDFRFRYQRIIREHFHPFGSIVIEGDPFAGYFNRSNYDLGFSFPYKGDIFSWEFELGYRYTIENPTAESERFQNKIRVHVGGVWNFTNTGSVELWGRYLPFLSDTGGGMPNYMFDYGISIRSFFSKDFYLNLSFIRNHREVPLEDRKQDDYRLIGSIGYKI